MLISLALSKAVEMMPTVKKLSSSPCQTTVAAATIPANTITEAAVARTVIGVAAERAAKKRHISAPVNVAISTQTTDNRL
jgi:hypothetical protein